MKCIGETNTLEAGACIHTYVEDAREHVAGGGDAAKGPAKEARVPAAAVAHGSRRRRPTAQGQHHTHIVAVLVLVLIQVQVQVRVPAPALALLLPLMIVLGLVVETRLESELRGL
jgi:hypothetical protein